MGPCWRYCINRVYGQETIQNCRQEAVTYMDEGMLVNTCRLDGTLHAVHSPLLLKVSRQLNHEPMQTQTRDACSAKIWCAKVLAGMPISTPRHKIPNVLVPHWPNIGASVAGWMDVAPAVIDNYMLRQLFGQAGVCA